MKHIKKKYLFKTKELPLKEGAKTEKINRLDSKVKDKIKGNVIFLQDSSDKEYIWSFGYNYNGKQTIIPMPDLSLVYYNKAYNDNIQRKKIEKDFFIKLTSENKITEDISNEVYNYFGYASGSIISLFTSIEAFVNHLIPDDYHFKVEQKNRTEIYNKLQIQKHLSFWDKVKKIIPNIYDKNFFQKDTPTNIHIKNLKDLRDDIIHTKSETYFSTQEEIMKRLLKFNYNKTLESVRKFMNYYKEDYAIDCNCNQKF